MKLKNIAYFTVVLALVAVFGISAWNVGSYFWDSHKARQDFEELSTAKKEAGQQLTTAPPEDSPATILAEYAPFYEQNPHTAGWIRIEGTTIDYPVMHCPQERDYYLKRNFQGEYSDHGSIYIREECDMATPSDNITVYGHNMLDGSMFAPLLDYREKTAWEDNPLIFFDTLTEYHTYKIFAVFKTPADGSGFPYYAMIDAADQGEFDAFIAQAKALSFYDTGITPKYGDKILCLSTCEYTLSDGRFVVAACRIW